jgi:hypothetical protein
MCKRHQQEDIKVFVRTFVYFMLLEKWQVSDNIITAFSRLSVLFLSNIKRSLT